ncbi:alpha/beta fold hydrolase [Streptococcus oricebi]|nr:alpha/beta hydrolase [Streptococcus oricebi]
MQALPSNYHFTKDYHPTEEWWAWGEHKVHLDTFRNPAAPAKLICFHGVGTNGRQISLIAGGPQAKAGFETIMIDMPTYGMTEVANRNQVTYDDWVQIGSDYIDFELARDKRPIFLYGLSAGGMETYHIAALNKKVKGIIGMTFLDQRVPLVRNETSYNYFMGKIGVPMTGLARRFGLGKMTTPMKRASKMSALVNDDQLLDLMLQDKTSAGNRASMNFLDSYMNYLPAVEAPDFDLCPVLLTQPELDCWTPLELSKPLLDKISQVPVDIVILPQGGHYPVEASALQVMNQAITDFIKKHS